MRRIYLLTALLLLASPFAFGSTTICKIDSTSLLPTAVSWDSSNGQAKAEFAIYGKKDGKLTLSRRHSEDGNKVNLVFPPSDPMFGDEFELIIFPVGPNKYRTLGVTYVISGGSKHLSFSLGDADATCATL